MRKTLFFIIIAFSVSLSSLCQSLSDVSKIKSKLYQISLDRALPVDMTLNMEVSEMLKTFDGSGSWSDINYQDNSASKWVAFHHLKRIFELSVQYRDKKSSHFGKNEVRDVILKGLQFWTNNPPHAANNWYNTIGAANLLGGIYVLMETELDNNLKAKGIELMKLGVKPQYYDYYGKATGQNALWLASAHMYASSLTNDIEGLKRVFSTVAEEIVFADGEGIQPDYSFYQHGRQNYAFGYGKGFSETAAKYFFLADNTAFQLSKDKIDILSSYLLQGQQWMSRYSYLEYTAMGRQISRKGIDLKPILSSLKWMMEVDPARHEKYKAFYNRLSDDRTEKPLVGNRYFWRSDLMVHHRPNYYFSLKSTSDRIASGESGNGENIKGWYQGNGTFYLIRSGSEYHEIFPIWDWKKLPGSLCSQTKEPLPLFLWGAGSQGATSFVYGLNDGMYGCFGYDYNKDNVKAKRAWFFFDNEILNLVSNVSGDSLYQSINQCLLNGQVWTRPKNKQGKIDRVYQDSVGYCINSTDQLLIKAENQTGSWNGINSSESSEPITKKVFSLGINLGNKVVDKSYSYAILPAISLGDFKKYKLSNHIQVLQNTKDIQSVFQKDIQQVQAVFYSAGKFDLPWSELTIEMKKPGLILIKKQMNRIIIDYSQPSEKKHVEFELTDKKLFQNEDIMIGLKKA